MQPLEKRPTNYARNVYHAISAVAALIVVHHVFIGPWLVWSATAFFVWVWGVELARHYSPILNGWVLALFGKVIHPGERQALSSGAWYALGLLLLALQGDRLVMTVALVALGFGDPAAAMIGRRWGKIALTKGRTLEGTLAFVVVSTLCCMLALTLYFAEQGLGQNLVYALAGSVAGALSEVLLRKIDDNLAIPVCAGAIVWVLRMSGGL